MTKIQKTCICTSQLLFQDGIDIFCSEQLLTGSHCKKDFLYNSITGYAAFNTQRKFLLYLGFTNYNDYTVYNTVNSILATQ